MLCIYVIIVDYGATPCTSIGLLMIILIYNHVHVILCIYYIVARLLLTISVYRYSLLNRRAYCYLYGVKTSA
jgi:hypothetical protein